MKRITYSEYENLVTEAVMRVVKDSNTRRPINEAASGGTVIGILLFLLALFGVSSSGLNLSSLFSSVSTSDNATQDQQQSQGAEQQQGTQQTAQDATQTDANHNNLNLEKLAKEKGLVDVMEMYSGRNIKYDPQYAKKLEQYYDNVFYSGTPKAYLDKTLAGKLDKVLKILEKQNCGLLIYDAARPLSVQNGIANAAMKYDTDKYGKYDPKYIAKGDTSKHLQGKAVDCTLYDIKTGKELEMGGGFDERKEYSATNYYENNKKYQKYHQNRMILYNAMAAAGISNYKEEWWHYQIS